MEKNIVALIYDFDKTLSPKDMQEYSFIPNIGMEPSEFWKESNDIAFSNQMDKILAYMYLMIDKARAARVQILRDEFVRLGKNIDFFPGVTDWFERISKYGRKKGIEVEHYIISSGLKEIIEGTSIFKFFKEIFACSFCYDVNGVAVWPAMSVNFTAKTQYIFRINKGILDRTNDDDLNHFTPQYQRRIPFNKMIYIGDGLTDVPSFRTIRLNGGYSIAVYQNENKLKVAELIQHDRVNFIATADYTSNSQLDNIVKKIIDFIEVEHQLDMYYHSQRQVFSK